VLDIVYRNAFKKEYALAQRRGKDMSKLHAVVRVLALGNVLDPRHKNHKLTGNFNGHWECHIQPDWLLIYKVTSAELSLYRTGSHADLFGK